MTCSYPRRLRYLLLCLGLVASISFSAPAQQRRSEPAGPINLDRETEEPVTPDRAVSYYHFSLAKWHEDNGEQAKALAEMETALKYNPTSPAIHLEISALMEKSGNSSEAIAYAQEAARLDPQDPDPHWMLVNVYLKPQRRPDPAALREAMTKALRELEILRELTPNDDRVYFALGGAYFETNQPEKAIQAYEKFQSISNRGDGGYREIAKYYERTGNEEKVIEYLKKGLQAYPDSTETLVMLGAIYARLGKYEEAIPIYSKLAEVTGNNPNVNRTLAETMVEVNRMSEALTILDEVLKAAPGDKRTLLLRGRALIGLRRYPEAIETLKDLSTNPDEFEARFYLSRAYQMNGNHSEAIKILSALLEGNTDPSEEARSNRFVFQQALAASYMEIGNHQKAIAIYREMAAADPKRANLQLLMAYRAAKLFDQALPLGKQLMEKEPDNIDIAVVYAHTLADAGKTKEGAEVLSNLLKSNPDNVDLYVSLSQIYLQAKKYEDAEKILLRAENSRKLDKENDEKLKYQRAHVYEQQKDFDRAELLFKEILKINPNSAVALNYIGYMLADRGVRLQEALKYVQEAVAIDPNNGAYLDSLGWAFFKLNDLENAERYLLEADELIKDDPVIDDHLGDLYFKTGNLQKAHDYWKTAVDQWTRDPSREESKEEVEKVRRKLEMVQEMIRKQKSEK